MTELIYLDTYVLQQDMRVRLPKAILTNMNVEKGKTQFDIYLNSKNNSLTFFLIDGKLDMAAPT